MAITVAGPALVTNGEAIRYTAFALYSDGTRQDVTRDVEWTPSAPPFNAESSASLYFIGPGVARAARPGETVVRAFYQTSGSAVGLLVVGVLDRGTFELTGVVTEDGGGPLSGATVEVTAGAGQGLRATTDAYGRYAIYGVAGPVQLRVSADGFAPQALSVVVAGHGLTHPFALTPLEATAHVGGVWTMTLAPSPTCRAGLPEIARGRLYHLELVQVGTRLQWGISGPTLTVHNRRAMDGTVVGSRVRLQIPGDTEESGWSWPLIYDRLSSIERFGFDGTVEVTAAGSEIRGTLNGDLVYLNSETDRYEPSWYCRAPDHAATLRR